MLTQLGASLVGFFDSIMVGRYATVDLAAVSFANAIFFTVMVFAMGALMGITPLVGIQVGASSSNSPISLSPHLLIASLFQNGMLFTILLSLVMLILLSTCIPFLDYFGQDPEVIKVARPYYILIVISLVPFLFFSFFRQFLEGLGNTFTRYDVYIDALFKFVPEFVVEGAFRGVFLCYLILLFGKLVADGFFSRLFIIARIDSEGGEKFDFVCRNVAIAAGVVFKVILVIAFRRIEVQKRPDFHMEGLGAAFFDFSDAQDRFLCLFVCVIHARLILRAHVVSLTVFDRRVNHVEVGKQKRVKAHLFRVILHAHGFAKARASGKNFLVICVFCAVSVGIAAFGIDYAGDGSEQVLNAPEATARKIDDVFLLV